MRVGIVGLPNVGKSTVFNSLARAGAEAQNYPFTTIDPNLGVTAVPDGRLGALAEAMRSKRVVPATVDLVDDIETIDTELLLADLATVERRLERVGRAAKSGDAKLKAEAAELERLRDHLSDGSQARSYPHSETLAEAMDTLITAKPTLYVANVDEESVAEGNSYSSRVEKLAAREGAEAVRISAKLEAEVVELSDDEAAEYLAMLGVETTGFEEFVRSAYRLLGLVTFFTAGEPESRAWTVRAGSTVRQAAGRIHTDMERGFIAAEVGDWQDIVNAGSWSRAKEEAKVRLEGRDYVVGDGDTVLVRFNV